MTLKDIHIQIDKETWADRQTDRGSARGTVDGKTESNIDYVFSV